LKSPSILTLRSARRSGFFSLEKFRDARESELRPLQFLQGAGGREANSGVRVPDQLEKLRRVGLRPRALER